MPTATMVKHHLKQHSAATRRSQVCKPQLLPRSTSQASNRPHKEKDEGELGEGSSRDTGRALLLLLLSAFIEVVAPAVRASDSTEAPPPRRLPLLLLEEEEDKELLLLLSWGSLSSSGGACHLVRP